MELLSMGIVLTALSRVYLGTREGPWVKRGNIRLYECFLRWSGQLPEPFHIQYIHNNKKLKVNEDFRHISISPSVNIHLYFYGNRAAASHYA